jgi:SAM-dependent methyltransferase
VSYQTAAQIYSDARPKYPKEFFSKVMTELRADYRNIYVDLGCGTGELMIPLSSSFDASIGVDPEIEMLNQVNLKAIDQNTRIKTYHGMAEDYFASIPKDFKIDLVTAGRSFHWMDHEVIIKQLKNHLKPEGLFVSVGENDGGIWNRKADWAQVMKDLIFNTFHLKKDFKPTNGIKIDWNRTRDKLKTLGEIQEVEFKAELIWSSDQIINLYLSSAGLFEWLGNDIDEFKHKSKEILLSMNQQDKFFFDFSIGMTIVKKYNDRAV